MTAPLPGALVRMLVALAALAGALLSAGAIGHGDELPAASTVAPAATVAPPSRLQRALPVVAERLVDARRSGRRKLAAARTAERQDAAAKALADAYHQAAARLGAPAREEGATALLGALDRASHAYVLLAKTAREGDRSGYKAARAEIAGAERRLPKAFSDALAGAG